MQDSSQFTENFAIQTTDGGTLPIPVLGSGTVETSDLLPKENGSMVEQSTDLIMVPGIFYGCVLVFVIHVRIQVN